MDYGRSLYEGWWKYQDGAYHIGYRVSMGMVTDILKIGTHEMTVCGKVMPTSKIQRWKTHKDDHVCPMCNQVDLMRRLAE